MRKALVVVFALLALAGGILAQRWLNSAPSSSLESSIAFPDLEGKPHLLSEWQGKVVIVNFWATWCPPCVEEMPEFVKLQTELGPKGVQFIGILTDDEAEAAREFLKSHPVNYPILDGSIGGRPWATQLGDSAEVLPFSAVFDAAGKQVHKEIGRFARDEVFKQIKPLLR